MALAIAFGVRNTGLVQHDRNNYPVEKGENTYCTSFLPSCLLPSASCLLPPASCLLPPAFCPLPSASCLLVLVNKAGEKRTAQHLSKAEIALNPITCHSNIESSFIGKDNIKRFVIVLTPLLKLLNRFLKFCIRN